MAITPLPQGTVRLLGAGQAITTPHALIKELIDNSIDAHATSIDIIISLNTLDRIEIRDNGHGIGVDDLDALGRRGHTSKLRTFEDLKAIGGVSLGFRGEALASAVQLGDVSVTTRTDGESVASLVKLKTTGGIASQSRCSHPVGTTVSVSKLMYKIPVRKKKFESEAPKTLKKTKELLQSYALARPQVRFSLKVNKSLKDSWSFSPRPNDGMKEAVSQILSRNLAGECMELSHSFIERDGSPEEKLTPDPTDQVENDSLESTFTVEAFLPKPNSDPSKLGFGQWISVDSRPVAHDKGTMRKIITVFKYYVKSAIASNGEPIKNPFLRMNIRCPMSSYDPNVEPAKDDILFGNESLVLASIEAMFKSLYGEKQASSNCKSSLTSDFEESADDFNLLLAREAPQAEASTGVEPLPVSKETAKEDTQIPLTTRPSNNTRHADLREILTESAAEEATKRKWGFDMSRDYSEQEATAAPKKRVGVYNTPQRSCQAVINCSDHLNPWLIAKMNAPVQEHINESNRVYRTLLLTPNSSSGPVAQSRRHRTITHGHGEPRQTSHNQDISTVSISPPRFDVNKHRKMLDQQGPKQDATQQRPSAPAGVGEGFGSDDVLENHVSGESRVGKVVQRNRLGFIEESNDDLSLGDDSETYNRRLGFISARNAPMPVDNPQMQDLQSRKKPRGLNKPFISPLRPVGNKEPVNLIRQAKIKSIHSNEQIVSPNGSQHDSAEDLAWAMDYEHRKDNVVRRRRDEIRNKRLRPDVLVVENMARQVSPHKNRYNAAIANLEDDISSKENVTLPEQPFKTSLPDDDARAYLMRRQRSVLLAQTNKLGEPPKPSRTKSLRLPLERVTDQEQLHNVLIKLPASASHLGHSTSMSAEYDAYASRGVQAAGLTMGALDTTFLATRVEGVVNQWVKASPGNDYEAFYSFENLLIFS